MDEIEFTLHGKRRTINRKQVMSAARGHEDEIHTHAVVIEGESYAVKPVFARATGLDLLDFTTSQARNVLMRLGFELKRL